MLLFSLCLSHPFRCLIFPVSVRVSISYLSSFSFPFAVSHESYNVRNLHLWNHLHTLYNSTDRGMPAISLYAIHLISCFRTAHTYALVHMTRETIFLRRFFFVARSAMPVKTPPSSPPLLSAPPSPRMFRQLSMPVNEQMTGPVPTTGGAISEEGRMNCCHQVQDEADGPTIRWGLL